MDMRRVMEPYTAQSLKVFTPNHHTFNVQCSFAVPGYYGTDGEDGVHIVRCESACCKCLSFSSVIMQVRKKNVLKDFVAAAGPLGVTHFLIFTKTDNSVNLVSSSTDLLDFC